MTDYDIVIRGGTVVDGMRLPRFRADVGIRNGRIAKIGRIASGDAARTLDANGLIVAPGFVDLHTHYDAQIHWDPYCTISGWHGVTSVVLGNCGFGFAPCRPQDRERSLMMMTRTEQIPYESMKAGMPWRWETFPEWLDNLQRIPKGVNVVSYVPVSPLMVYVMGLDAAKNRPATLAEQHQMQRLLHEAMDAGACGFSIQRLGPHSLQADYDGTPMPTDCMADEDVLVLADVLRERDEGFIQITQAAGGDPVRSGDAVKSRDRAFVELLAERAQRPVLHNAIAAIDDRPQFHKSEMEWVRSCNERGLRIIGQGANVRTWFAFTLDLWNLYDYSPAWNHATQGTTAEKLAKLSDPALRVKLRDEEPMLASIGEQTRPGHLVITKTPRHPELEKYVGRKISDIAAAEGKHVVDAMLDIAVAGELLVEFRGGEATSGNPKMVGELMRDPYVIAGVSDGGAHTKFFTGGSYTTDLLTWLVRDTHELTLEEAHYHLSFLPAQAAGFTDRGFLREGAPADVVVYDLAKLRRTPEWDYEIAHDFPANEWRRIQRAEGYRWTIVNGVVTFEDGRCTGATSGQLLRNRRIEPVALSEIAAA
jgi:N-acyl-D-aspartate/D-glutamate deacylase